MLSGAKQWKVLEQKKEVFAQARQVQFPVYILINIVVKHKKILFWQL